MISEDRSGPELTTGRFLPLLILLFMGSGCAALIYEIVWFQMLQLVIGSTGVSLGILLASFMGGMCLGSLWLPRFVSMKRHPLRVYAALEIGIGVLGLLMLALIPLVGGAYVRFVPYGLPSVLLRALLAGLLLLPPTVLMGATLPAIARYVESSPVGVSWMGFFYAGNIAGAVLGSLGAGFYLLRRYDVVVATGAALGLNLAVAALAFGLARLAGYQAREHGTAPPPRLNEERYRVVLIAIALSGLTALGAEVVWTRLMALALGATTYTFSIILSVFLAMLGIGSGVGSYVARSVERPRVAFAFCQAGALVGIAWTAHAISAQLPFWPVTPQIASSPLFVFQLDLARTFWALAPAPFFWGASFPLAVAAVAEEGQDSGALVGRVYAFNTLGAIGGSLGFGVLVIPWLGTQRAQQLLIGLAAYSALLLAAPVLRRRDGSGVRVAGALVGLVVATMLSLSVRSVPSVLVAYGRFAPTYEEPQTLYVGEGRNSTVAVTELDSGVRNIHVGGKIVASTESQDMRLQGMLGHLSGLLHPDPKSVLVVGFGAGVTAGTFVHYPGVERIVIVEIEPLVTSEPASYFALENNSVLSDPRVQVIHDDARHFLLTTDETFDLITSDPIHPWMKGAAALYSREYFEVARDRLNPEGVITQWVPLYETTSEAVRSEIATFLAAFPEGTVWGNTYDTGGGYDVVLAAKKDSLEIDVDAYVDRILRPDYARVAVSLSEAGFTRALDLLSTYAGDGDDLSAWLEGAAVNRDRNLRLMYLAGLGLNEYVAADIYQEILAHRSFPDELFVGEPGRVEVLRNLIDLR